MHYLPKDLPQGEYFTNWFQLKRRTGKFVVDVILQLNSFSNLIFFPLKIYACLYVCVYVLTCVLIQK